VGGKREGEGFARAPDLYSPRQIKTHRRHRPAPRPTKRRPPGRDDAPLQQGLGHAGVERGHPGGVGHDDRGAMPGAFEPRHALRVGGGSPQEVGFFRAGGLQDGVHFVLDGFVDLGRRGAGG